MVCQTSIGRVDEEVVSFFSFSPYSENLLTNGSDDFISCRFIDKVGNPSAELNFTVSADFQLPIPIFTSNTVEGYQFFDTIFTGECLDEHQDATLVLMVQEPNSSTRNQTLNRNTSYSFEDVLLNTSQTRQLLMRIACVDMFGNANSSQWHTLNYLGGLSSLTTTQTGTYQQANTTYLRFRRQVVQDFDTHSSTTIGYVSYTITLNGTIVSTIDRNMATGAYLNSSDIQQIFSSYSSSTVLEIKATHRVNGTSEIPQIFLGKFKSLLAPTILTVGKTTLANGSSTFVQYSTT